MMASAANPFSAKWTATGNKLCLGKWEISHLGKPLKLDTARAEEDMGTYAIYSFIYPDDDIFAEGLKEEEWIIENLDWLTQIFLAHDIPTDEAHFRFFYRAVNRQDWRCGSCGGCM
ncbi:MAG: hypothetical protein Q7U94_00310 [Sideroxyarcus sp.]|nr:hypothetical protein [Sideroxyarcus sp.]